ncbi:MAG: prepilin peptidase, partial [Alcaligenes aquatilis]
MMWTSWGNAWAGMGLALVLAICFVWPARRLSWSLPIELEPELTGRSPRTHRQWGWVCQSLALVLMLWAGWRWQLTPAAVAACVFIAGTALLAWIDAETGYLPDR